MVKVTVTDPQTENEGRRDQYTTYLVSTDAGGSIRRRYSDFQWLYGRLQTELPGAIVPIIPHKIAIMKGKKFDPEFVETRRRHLQLFLETVVAHHELARAPSMTPFMLDRLGTEFDVGRKKVETSNPTFLTDADDATNTSTAKKVSNMFAKAGTLMRVRAGKKELMHTPEEREIEKLNAYLEMVESQVKPLVRAAEALTKVTKDMAGVVGDMCDPLQEWKTTYLRSTNTSDPVCDMMSALVEFSNDYTKLISHKHYEEQMQFEDRMVQMGNHLKAFKIALKQRKHWHLSYTTRIEQINAKDDQIAKATQNLKPPEVTGRLSFERTELHKLAGQEKSKLEECTARVLREADANKSRLEMTLKEAFCLYAKIQISYTNRINDAWGQLLPFVDGEHNKEDENQEASAEEAPMGSTQAAPASAPPPPPSADNEEDKDT